MDVKWIKIATDIFNDEKILLIESMPEAESLIVIWFKLLCMAGRTNNGGAFWLNDRIAYTDEMFAQIFRRPIQTVRLALNTFEELGMVERIEGVVTIPNWEKHQNIDGLERIREQERIRKQRQRELARIESRDSHGTVTDSHATEEEKEEDKEENRLYSYVVDYLNEKAGTAYKSSSKKTRALIHARVAEGFALDDFKKVIDTKVAEWKDDAKMAQFLRPETLFSPKFEGYLNQKPVTQKRKSTNGFDNYQGRDIDYDALLNQI